MNLLLLIAESIWQLWITAVAADFVAGFLAATLNRRRGVLAVILIGAVEIRREIWPFAICHPVLRFFDATSTTERFICSCLIFSWAVLRKYDDDDRWKRRGRKAREAVRRLGSRLIVAVASG